MYVKNPFCVNCDAKKNALTAQTPTATTLISFFVYNFWTEVEVNSEIVSLLFMLMSLSKFWIDGSMFVTPSFTEKRHIECILL